MTTKLNNHFFYKQILLFCIGLSVLKTNTAFATKTSGRISLGATSVSEKYAQSTSGSTTNDILIASGRFFYKIIDLGTDKWEIVTDIRDKNDFFGHLNKDLLQLDSKNDFQIRQLSARWLNPAGAISTTMGRFQVLEAGSVFVDGANLEYRITRELKTGIFAGLNPKKIESPNLEFQQDAQEAGLYLTYQSKSRDWDDNFYLTHGLVQQKYKSETERSYLFQNLVYQWQEDSRVINTAYFDFVPSSKVQTLNFLYQQWLNDIFSTELGYLRIDVIEYRRKQGLLEKLTASPYSETHLSVDSRIDRKQTLKAKVSFGQREIDSLKKTEYSIGHNISQLFSDKVDLQTQIGIRKNFTSDDQFFKFDIGYFSKSWELFINQQFEQNKNIDGTTSHPLTSELGVTSYLSRQFFITGSFQRIADETVTIYSTLFRLSYRFGDTESAPIRDGAPPRGAL